MDHRNRFRILFVLFTVSPFVGGGLLLLLVNIFDGFDLANSPFRALAVLAPVAFLAPSLWAYRRMRAEDPRRATKAALLGIAIWIALSFALMRWRMSSHDRGDRVQHRGLSGD